MRWREFHIPSLREVGRRGDVVDAVAVQDPRPGDIDLSGMQGWCASCGGFGYIISIDHAAGTGYVASCRPLGAPPSKIIGDESDSLTHWLTDRKGGVRTFSEAEAICKAHARGRRDA
jgi:hypothetical protein